MTSVQLNQDLGLVLVDTGYYIFNRYFATLKWWRIVHKDETVVIDTLHENEEFIAALQTHIMNDLIRYSTFPYIEKRFKITPIPKNKKIRNMIIFCIDCSRNKIWRMKRYPEYKATRKHVADMNMQVVTKLYEYIDACIADTENGLHVERLGIDQLEADDIVYLTLNQARIIGYTPQVLIITNDNDFLQMISLGATVVNAQGVYLNERIIYEPKIYTIIKVLVGDLSDNIKPVPCIGTNMKLAAEVAAMTEKQRYNYIKTNGDAQCVKAYNLNKKLILLSMIPTTLAQTFTQKFTISVTKAI
jgi:5'-3' exonuclease